MAFTEGGGSPEPKEAQGLRVALPDGIQRLAGFWDIVEPRFAAYSSIPTHNEKGRGDFIDTFSGYDFHSLPTLFICTAFLLKPNGEVKDISRTHTPDDDSLWIVTSGQNCINYTSDNEKLDVRYRTTVHGPGSTDPHKREVALTQVLPSAGGSQTEHKVSILEETNQGTIEGIFGDSSGELPITHYKYILTAYNGATGASIEYGVKQSHAK